LDQAQRIGLGVRLHTLALRQTLPGLGELAALTRSRWAAQLSLGPCRPKPGVWDFDHGAPSLVEVSNALTGIPLADLALVGWPACLAPQRTRDAALVIRLYFLGQARTHPSFCEPCSLRHKCPGLVNAISKRDGELGLTLAN
jgi:hypothetical protein